jgi:hypothetical protein
MQRREEEERDDDLLVIGRVRPSISASERVAVCLLSFFT